MAPFFMNVPVPIDKIMEVYRLLGDPQPARPPVPAYDPFAMAPPRRSGHYHVWTWTPDGLDERCRECGIYKDHTRPVAEMVPLEVDDEPDPEPQPVIVRRKPRAKPRCKEVKYFGTKKVRCLKHPNHEGRHSWMDAAT